VPVEPRPASSVVLIRPGARAPVETWVIRRARAMRFLGGYYAFPGGKVDPADRRPDAFARVHGLEPDEAAARLGDTADVPPLAYWIAGVRELFEETGVLLAVDAGGRPLGAERPGVAARLEAHRLSLVRGARSLAAILADEGWRAELSSFAYLTHFITPPSSPIRFSARFFLCPVPPGQAPRLIPEETTEGRWIAPGLAYARFCAGEWPMAEPAEYTMRYLAQFESCEAVWQNHADGRHRFDGIIHRLEPAVADPRDREPLDRPAAAGARHGRA
jgi:8-oxo-dGTP pyrophosphatase MutT (NUDIX family)